jgi:hypothetical protein
MLFALMKLLFFVVKVTVIETLASNTFTVALKKQRVPVTVRNRVVSHKAAYYGTVLVGHPRPKNFTVVFDTGSAHFILPSSRCGSEACRNHRRYDRLASASALEINYDGSPVRGTDGRDEVVVSYGTGEVTGEFVSEVACLGLDFGCTDEQQVDSVHCARARIIHAHNMSTEPFKHFVFDGVIGLGLEGLALDPEFSFFGQLTRRSSVAPIFGVFLAASDSGDTSEITFGGHNEARAASSLQWVPVVSPAKGYWQVSIQSIRIGSEQLDICGAGDCVAVLDTGMSSLGVPQKSSPSFHLNLARPVPAGYPVDVDCRAVPGPTLTFDFGSFSVELEADDYSRPAPMLVPRKDSIGSDPHVICRASLIPLNLQVLGSNAFLLGEPVLQKYYTAYDTHKQRIGFARAVQETSTDSTKVRPGALQDVLPRWSADTSVVIV